MIFKICKFYKKNNLVGFVFFLLVFSCNDSKHENHDDEKQQFRIADWKNEILDVDSIKINGKANYRMSIQTMCNLLNDPKEIIQTSALQNLYLFDKGEKKHLNGYAVYNGLQFSLYEDIAIVNFIDFEANLEITLEHPRIILNHNTTLLEVSKAFPNSCKLIDIGGNVWSGVVIIKSTYKHIDSMRWFLIFRGEKLQRIMLVNIMMYK